MVRDTRTILLDTEKLKTLRRQHGWSQQQLADEAKVSKKTVERWEKGHAAFPRQVAMLEEVLGEPMRRADEPVSRESDEPVAAPAKAGGLERDILIRNVRKIWIDGVLGQSLAAYRSIAVDLNTDVDLVEHPWSDTPIASRCPVDLRADATAKRAFAYFGQALLILGAPGAGKTTLLLQLAERQLAEAERSDDVPVPAVFNLSAWATQRRCLKEWLADELNRRYEIALGTAQRWIELGTLLPMLDGLDEVPLEHREACVSEINDFRAEQRRNRGEVPIVVCCRKEPYEHLSSRLALGGALILRGLTEEKVKAYLRQDDKTLARAHEALKADPALWDIIDSPLMLGVLVQATERRQLAPSPPGISKKERRAWLFDAYVNEMFDRRGRVHRYGKRETVQWLSGLVAVLGGGRETVLYLESMQPTWLPSRPFVDVAVLAPLLISGLAVGLLFGFGARLVMGEDFALWIGLVLGTAGPIAFWKLGYGNKIEPVETLHWSWSSVTYRWKPRSLGALMFGLLFGFFGWLVDGDSLGLIFGVLTAGMFFLFFELPGRTSESHPEPNQGIKRSLVSSVITGAVGTVVLSVVLAIYLEPKAGAVFGLGLGIIIALLNGGHACVQHGVLRVLLWKCRLAPLNYVPFLDFASQLILIRKVGGGYMFIHDLFRDHFADRNTDEPPDMSSAITARNRPDGPVDTPAAMEDASEPLN